MSSRHDWACEESVVRGGPSVLGRAGRGAADQDRALLGNDQVASGWSSLRSRGAFAGDDG